MCPVRPRTIVLTVIVIPHLMAVPTTTTTTTVVVIIVINLIIIITTKMDPLLTSLNYRSGIVVFRDQR